jgi:hypothetical protein
VEPDYSLRSLYGLERILGKNRRLLAEDPAALSPEALGLIALRSAAYLAEVLQRAVPGTDLSVTGGQLLVTVTGGFVPGLTLKMMPLVRVARLLHEEDGEGTLVAWVAFADVMAHRPEAAAGAEPGDSDETGGSGAGQET